MVVASSSGRCQSMARLRSRIGTDHPPRPNRRLAGGPRHDPHRARRRCRRRSPPEYLPASPCPRLHRTRRPPARSRLAAAERLKLIGDRAHLRHEPGGSAWRWRRSCTSPSEARGLPATDPWHGATPVMFSGLSRQNGCACTRWQAPGVTVLGGRSALTVTIAGAMNHHI